MFLIYNTIIINDIHVSYAQNLSSSISLKANAGEDQYVEEGKPVILNAEDSLSSDPPIDSYNWFQIEPKDPKVILENSNTSRTSFISPNLPKDGNIVFQLIIHDGNITDTDTVNVYVVEDLKSLTKLQSGEEANYQPEQCFDGGDNDLDGKVDLQDEECGMTFMPQFPNQIPFQPHPGDTPFNPQLQGRPNSQFPDGQLQPERGQPGQIQPGQGPLVP